MSTTFIQPGDILTFTAPGGGVTAGTPVLIGDTLVVPTATVAAGLTFQGKTTGVFTCPKTAAQAWAEGVILYWDNTAKSFTTTSTANRRMGAAAVAALAADTTGAVRLTGLPATAVGGAAP